MIRRPPRRLLLYPCKTQLGKVERLDKGLDEALTKGWTVVSMKDDWNTIFPAK